MTSLKKLMIVTGFLLLAGPSAVFADATPTPTPAPTPAQPEKEVSININEAYVPRGFDSTSDVFVVASGLFPNSCYRWKRADVNNVDNFNHEVRSYAAVRPGMCLMVMIPFNQEIHLGKLIAGDHVIRFVNGDGTYMEKNLKIER